MIENPNENARKALDEMKLEIANELNITITNAGKVGGTMTKRLVEMGQNQLVDENKLEESSLNKQI
ncbi:MAG TPA: alpha/beta-type small acid-soluble spore protein [Tissierellaceae bacterium]|nr:alpha/beta-type small acid-soluble spore protein [Tissierellaceae bacterium]